MPGVGERLGPLILAEIGNVRRFHSGKALNAYAGNDAPPYQSGNFESHNRHISKRGNAALRKYCFEVMQALKLLKPQDDPVYLFLVKKEQEGKPYNVAKMAGVNKFLRIYYARVMELEKVNLYLLLYIFFKSTTCGFIKFTLFRDLTFNIFI